MLDWNNGGKPWYAVSYGTLVGGFMAKPIFLVYERDDEATKKTYVGFSWTCFFFNFFPALVRRDYKSAVVLFFCAFFLSVISRLLTTNLGNIGLFIAFGLQLCYMVGLGATYNRYYTQKLLKQGWKPVDEEDKEILKKYNFI